MKIIVEYNVDVHEHNKVTGITLCNTFVLLQYVVYDIVKKLLLCS